MALNYHILCLTSFLLLVLCKVDGYPDIPYNCKLFKNRFPPTNNNTKCGNCLEGYSEDIYDEDQLPKCIPNAKPVHFECRCNKKLLFCPKYLEGDANMSWAVDCVVKGVYPMPNISFLMKNDILLVPSALDVNTTCEYSPDGHGSLTVRCQLGSKDVQRIQQLQMPEVGLIFEVRHSFGSHSELVALLRPQQQPQNLSTGGDYWHWIITEVLSTIYVVGAFIIIYAFGNRCFKCYRRACSSYRGAVRRLIENNHAD